MNEKNIWIMAGEASGDLYGSHLYHEIKKKLPDATIKGMGAQEMKKAGVDILVDSSELGVIGFVEVIKMYPTFKRLFNQLLKQAIEEKPDAVIMIDYPGFNLRLAKKLHAAGIKVIWYVCPQVWAWGKKRIPVFAEVVSKMLVIFPFETETFKHTSLDVEFVGHPLVDILSEVPRPERDPNLLLLLPGSRRSEISRLLKDMILTANKVAENNPNVRFVLPTPREAIQEMVQEMLVKLAPTAPIKVVCGESVEWMCKASAGIAASGTVTVQAAILGLPLISTYRLQSLTYQVASRIVDIPYFTMINFIAKKEIYPEFLQSEVCPEKLIPALESIMPNGSRRVQIEQDLKDVLQLLGGKQGAFENASAAIIKAL